MSAKDAGARLPRGIARFRGRYRVRMDHQGTTHSLGVFQTITDAKAALHIAKADAARGTFVPPAQRRAERQAEAVRVQTEALTLGEWAQHLAYLEGREPAGGFTGAPGWDMEWCMDELGWEVTAHPDGGGVGFGGVADQAVGMDSAMEACTDFLGLRDMDPFTEDFLTLQYDNNLQIADCLRGMGFAVDDPPSREVYVQQTIAKRWTAWNVHEHVPDGQLGTVQRQCPGRPLWELHAESNQ